MPKSERLLTSVLGPLFAVMTAHQIAHGDRGGASIGSKSALVIGRSQQANRQGAAKRYRELKQRAGKAEKGS